MQIWGLSGSDAALLLTRTHILHAGTVFNEELPENQETFSPCDSSIRVRPNLGLFKFETEKTPR
jgi:hypothetical protein